MCTNPVLPAQLAFAASIILLLSPAWAYERPNAISLAGEWDLCLVEPMIDIVTDRAAKPDFPQLSPTWEEVIDPAALPPWDGEWQPVPVPTAWEQVAGLGYNGAGWYARFADIPPEWCGEGNRIWLEFDAVATAVGVWANNQFVGAHIGDYSRWRLELTNVVAQALGAPRAFAEEIPGVVDGPSVINPYTLLIAVYVDELPGHVTQGFLNMIAPHHGGIWQDVRMYSTGPVSIEPDGVRVQANPATGEVEVAVELDSKIPVDSEHFSLLLAFLAPKGVEDRVDLTVGGVHREHCTVDVEAGEITVRHKVDTPMLWSLENPHLYELIVAANFTKTRSSSSEYPGSLQSDNVLQSFAFRDVRIDSSQVMLNDKPIQIRSALNWGYYPGTISPAPAPEQVREEFAYIKSLGFNAETVCLVNMPDYFYNVADEMGMLLWQEYPTWHNDFTAKHEKTLQSEFTSYFRRDRNHPSIILRSISVEAGVDDQQVMAGLCSLARKMTDTPVQDNNSWFWLSNVELTDWYGEDNYLNCNQWARHMLKTLPAKLDELPEKPYIIGETMCFNCWPNVDGLSRFLVAANDPVVTGAKPGLFGSSEYWRSVGIEPNPALGRQFGGPSPYPYWYPICFDRCAEIEWELSERYNTSLPEGEDIIFDYLKRQSEDYATASRRFQIQLMNADPRYAGYTINVVRDIPQLRGGLIDDLGIPRYDTANWSWHGEHTRSSETLALPTSQQLTADAWREQTQPLLAWRDEWGAIDRTSFIYVIDGGYQDVRALTMGWDRSLAIAAGEVPMLKPLTGLNPRRVVLTSVLTDDMVPYMEAGGVVILLTSKWPGGLGSHQHFFWRDSFFAPPVGPFDRADSDKLVQLHLFDLTFEKSEVIPVDSLGITDDIDPLIRLYDTHDLDTVVTYDALFATRVGEGMLIGSSLDHSTDGGQWVLGELCSWASAWSYAADTLEPRLIISVQRLPNIEEVKAAEQLRGFPQVAISPETLMELATAQANTIIPLDEDWRFILDPEQRGEENGYYRPDILIEFANAIDCGKSWESQGFSYDGMAWYRKWVDIPEDWESGSVKLIAEGIDDAYRVWVNGEPVALHGSFTKHEETVWLVQTVSDLTEHLRPGEPNLIVLQVVDITGQGGVYKPLYLAVE